MQTRKDDRAFPHTFDEFVALGLTKREYFALMALQGYLAGGITVEQGAIQRSIKAGDRLIYELNQTDSEKTTHDSNPTEPDGPTDGSRST